MKVRCLNAVFIFHRFLGLTAAETVKLVMFYLSKGIINQKVSSYFFIETNFLINKKHECFSAEHVLDEVSEVCSVSLKSLRKCFLNLSIINDNY